MKEKKLVYGVGINDADYPTSIEAFVDGKRKVIWTCPFFRKWKHVMERSYSEKLHNRFPSYIGCSVVTEWRRFSSFKSWMDTQDWKGKQLDKDILAIGNKTYGPDTCVFVDPKINSFIIEAEAARGEWPIGVYFDPKRNKFRSVCRCIFTNKQKHLGYFDTPEAAHEKWLTFKLEQAKILASQQSDPRVAAALIDRYENYHTYFGETK